MQLGHVGIALSIASYDWSPKTILIVGTAHFLPNFDSLVIRAGIKDEKFHGTITHTLLFAFLVSGLVLIFSKKYALLTFLSLLAHFLADMGVDVGVPLWWPLSKKRVTLNLWRTSGYWGKEMYLGYYRQLWPLFLELAVLAFLTYRLLVIYT